MFTTRRQVEDAELWQGWVSTSGHCGAFELLEQGFFSAGRVGSANLTAYSPEARTESFTKSFM